MQGAAHAADVRIAREKTLVGGLRDRLGRGRQFQTLLERDEPVQPTPPDTPFGDPSGHRVDNTHLAVAHHVVAAGQIEVTRLERHRQPFGAMVFVDPLALGGRQHRRVQLHRPSCFVDAVIAPGLQTLGQSPGLPGPHTLGRVASRRGHDQRHRRFVDENAVRFVDEHRIETRQHRCGRQAVGEHARAHHERAGLSLYAGLVAQGVEHHRLGRRIHDFGTVGFPASIERIRFGHRAHAQSERGVERIEPGRIALDQIGIGGEHMHPLPGQRRYGRRQRGGQRLALAGRHFGEPAVDHRQRGEPLLFVGRDAHVFAARAIDPGTGGEPQIAPHAGLLHGRAPGFRRHSVGCRPQLTQACVLTPITRQRATEVTRPFECPRVETCRMIERTCRTQNHFAPSGSKRPSTNCRPRRHNWLASDEAPCSNLA